MVTSPAIQTRPVMLVRYRWDVLGPAARIVHAIPLPADTQTGLIGALCGAVLRLAASRPSLPGRACPAPSASTTAPRALRRSRRQ
jgi:hypothetical protein